MAGGMVRVDFGGLDTLHGQLQARVADLETLLGQITQHVDQVNAEWQGQGNGSFNGAAQHWHGQQAQIRQVLDEIRATVRTSNMNYQTTEHGVAQSFGGFGG